MCTFKQTLKFLMGRICGREYGVLYKNGERCIVPSEQLRKLNILLTESYGQDGRLSAPQVNNILNQTRAVGRRTQPMQVTDGNSYKYFNYPYRDGALIFDNNSKLVFGITTKARMPAFRRCLPMI